MLNLDSSREFPALGVTPPDLGAEPPVAPAPPAAETPPRRDARKPRWHRAFYATSSPAASALRRQQEAGGRPSRNASRVQDFITGACTASDVLRATVSGMVLCGSRTADARACFDELDRAVNARTGERVHPDVSVYNALISAHERAGQPKRAAEYLDHAVRSGVFLHALGYDRADNTVNFHRYAVERGAEFKTEGICADVARSIFRRLFDRGIINAETEFIVGHRGGHKIGDAIWDCMGDVGWPPRHPVNGRARNEGRLAVDLQG